MLANQHTQATALQDAKHVFVALVVAEVGNRRININLRQDASHCVTFAAVGHADFQSSVKWLKHEARVVSDRSPALPHLAANVVGFLLRKSAPMDGQAARLVFSPI